MAVTDDFNTPAEAITKWCQPSLYVGGAVGPDSMDLVGSAEAPPMTNRIKCVHAYCNSWRWYDYPDAGEGLRRGFCGAANLHHGVFPKRRGTSASLNE